MLKLHGCTAPPPVPSIALDEVSVWWDDARDGHPHSWWAIDSPDSYLYTELNTDTGLVTAVRWLIWNETRPSNVPLWDDLRVEVGHPQMVVGLASYEWSVDPDVRSYVFQHSDSQVKVHWGQEVRVLLSGRCVFGFDGASQFVSFGIRDLSPGEAHSVVASVQARKRTRST